MRVFADTGFYQVTGEMGARDQVGVASIGERAFKTAVDADFRQSSCHVFGAFMSAAPGTLQTVLHVRVVNVKAQADDVHRAPGKRHRDFGTAQVAHAQCFGRARRARLATNFVMVGQRPQLNTIGMCSGGQGFGRERAI